MSIPQNIQTVRFEDKFIHVASRRNSNVTVAQSLKYEAVESVAIRKSLIAADVTEMITATKKIMDTIISVMDMIISVVDVMDMTDMADMAEMMNINLRHGAMVVVMADVVEKLTKNKLDSLGLYVKMVAT
jgi:hypothetical protein